MQVSLSSLHSQWFDYFALGRPPRFRHRRHTRFTGITPNRHGSSGDRSLGWAHSGRRPESSPANAKAKVFSKVAKEIMIAARGDPDLAMNARLRTAVESAKKASMPRETLERAIKKGTGLLDEPVS